MNHVLTFDEREEARLKQIQWTDQAKGVVARVLPTKAEEANDVPEPGSKHTDFVCSKLWTDMVKEYQEAHGVVGADRNGNYVYDSQIRHSSGTKWDCIKYGHVTTLNSCKCVTCGAAL